MRACDPRAFATEGWFKATASNDNGTGCVEVNFRSEGWFKASVSEANGTGCVEVNLDTPRLVGLRDSKNPEGGTFVFTATEWRSFLASL